MSKASAVLKASDDMIREVATTRTDGVIYYAIGQKVSVTYRGGGRYLCGTCKGNDRYQSHDHRGCCHIQRVQRYREERQELLNDMKADPALEVPVA